MIEPMNSPDIRKQQKMLEVYTYKYMETYTHMNIYCDIHTCMNTNPHIPIYAKTKNYIYNIYILKISGMPPAHYFRNLGKNQGSGPIRDSKKKLVSPLIGWWQRGTSL